MNTTNLLFSLKRITFQKPTNLSFLRYFSHSINTRTRTLAKSQGRVVILGSGWGSYQLLRKINKDDYEVSVVSPRNYFVFTPLLASTSVGTLEFRCITEPVRQYSKDIDYHQAWVDGIDFKNQLVHCSSNNEDNKGEKFDIEFDKLVIGVGAYSNTFNIPGVKDHAYFLKDIGDAKKIRNRVLECFEYAAQPGISDKEKDEKLHFVVVGAGPTGVEFSAELYDFITEDLSRLYGNLMEHVRMTIYDVAPHILNSFDKKLSDYATSKFNRRGIQIKTNSHVMKVDKHQLEIKEEGTVPYGMLVWNTGLQANPLVESLKDVSKDKKNQRILTNDLLQVLDTEKQPYPNVYALGDCATILDQDLPATAQVANQKAIYLGRVLNKQIKGKQDNVEGFTFKNMGTMAYIGKWNAVVDMSGAINENATATGTSAWLFWRSAYLSMTVSTRNKILIPMFWFLSFQFGRNVSKI